MKLFDKNFDFFASNDDYKYTKGQVVYFYDSKHNNVRTMKINHKMSGWDSDDWEYYHCSCIDPKTTWENDMSELTKVSTFIDTVFFLRNRGL